MIVAKQGEYGAALITREGFFALPAFPLENVIDPTGAGDTFAGGFVGYIAAHPEEELTDELLRRAMAYGTALASFNVEEFGTERVERLTGEEIAARVEELREITQLQRRAAEAARLSCRVTFEPSAPRRLVTPPRGGYTISARWMPGPSSG